jgi:IS30 family transposase
MKDAASKGRFNVPRPNHPHRKLSEADVERICALRRAGMTLAAIGAQFGVTKSCVSFIVRGLRRVYNAPQYRSAQRREVVA